MICKFCKDEKSKGVCPCQLKLCIRCDKRIPITRRLDKCKPCMKITINDRKAIKQIKVCADCGIELASYIVYTRCKNCRKFDNLSKPLSSHL
jgi:hypothetical protein